MKKYRFMSFALFSIVSVLGLFSVKSAFATLPSYNYDTTAANSSTASNFTATTTPGIIQFHEISVDGSDPNNPIPNYTPAAKVYTTDAVDQKFTDFKNTDTTFVKSTDTTYVKTTDTVFTNKADASDVTNALATKADKTALADKADTSTVTNLSTTVGTINDTLATKADTSAVTSLSTTVGNLSTTVGTINDTLATKADKTALADVYKKTEVDSAVNAAKALVTTLEGQLDSKVATKVASSISSDKTVVSSVLTATSDSLGKKSDGTSKTIAEAINEKASVSVGTNGTITLTTTSSTATTSGILRDTSTSTSVYTTAQVDSKVSSLQGQINNFQGRINSLDTKINQVAAMSAAIDFSRPAEGRHVYTFAGYGRYLNTNAFGFGAVIVPTWNKYIDGALGMAVVPSGHSQFKARLGYSW
jgi:hypothetical protein